MSNTATVFLLCLCIAAIKMLFPRVKEHKYLNHTDELLTHLKDNVTSLSNRIFFKVFGCYEYYGGDAEKANLELVRQEAINLAARMGAVVRITTFFCADNGLNWDTLRFEFARKPSHWKICQMAQAWAEGSTEEPLTLGYLYPETELRGVLRYLNSLTDGERFALIKEDTLPTFVRVVQPQLFSHDEPPASALVSA